MESIKYGGPFTTKQVEDVKVLWSIIKILIFIGPVFMLQTVTQAVLPPFSKHGILFESNETGYHHQVYLEGISRHIIISNGLLSPLLVVICIPLYLYLIRPRLYYHIPGMLKRIGLGLCLIILSLGACLAMDLVAHKRKSPIDCMFSGYVDNLSNIQVLDGISLPLYLNAYFLTGQYLLSGVINMLIDIAVLEFICSQSPYSMKGLLLGTFFFIKNLFQAIAIASILPFGLYWHIKSLSCGSGYYIMNIVIGLVNLALFTFMAKIYKYRTINEPSNEYRYAEDYYSNVR